MLNSHLKELYLRTLLSQILREIADKLKTLDSPPTYNVKLVDYNSWKKLIGTFRYLGGTPETYDAKGFPSDPDVKSFMISPSNGQGIYSFEAYNDERTNAFYPNPQLIDFIPNTIVALKSFGGIFSKTDDSDAIFHAMRELKEYTANKQPTIALILRNIAINYDDNDLNDLNAFRISEFLNIRMYEGEFYTASLRSVGIPEGIFPGNDCGEQFLFAGKALYSLHYPTEL